MVSGNGCPRARPSHPATLSITSGPVRGAESDELVGIDFDLDEALTLSTPQLLLTMEIEPFIVVSGRLRSGIRRKAS